MLRQALRQAGAIVAIDQTDRTRTRLEISQPRFLQKHMVLANRFVFSQFAVLGGWKHGGSLAALADAENEQKENAAGPSAVGADAILVQLGRGLVALLI
jgi:hypothetical protein